MTKQAAEARFSVIATTVQLPTFWIHQALFVCLFVFIVLRPTLQCLDGGDILEDQLYSYRRRGNESSGPT